MKTLPLAGVVVLAAAAGGTVGTWWSSSREPGPPIVDSSAEVAALSRRVDELTARLDGMHAASPAVAGPERRDAVALLPDAAMSPAARDAFWYLDQYVRSFADDVHGVEYYRLAVEAHVVELASPIAVLVRDTGRPQALRIALTAMLGSRRFAAAADVIAALLVALAPPSPDALAERALASLAAIDSAAAVPGLERTVPLLREPGLQSRALALLAELAGADRDAILLRLFVACGDEALRTLLVQLLDGADAVAALELLREASTGAQPLRLAAAQRVVEFDVPAFEGLVAAWLPRETDAQVRAVLGGEARPSDLPGWSARQATGQPDADPSRDDPKAWAPRSGEMGRQWLQLGYASPTVAQAVRIFEVNTRGCVVEVQVRGTGGGWTTVWSGNAETPSGPLVISFPRTTFAVRSVRILLDTDRRPGWDEIDAVELLGPGGGQWATRATASSSYGSRAGNALQGAAGDEVQFLKGMRRR